MRRRFMNISNSMPLSFEALEDGLSISFSNGILYCINGGAWETLLAGEQTEEVNKGSVISFRHAKSISSYGVGTFSINKKCNVYGACSSIIPKFFGEKYMADYLFARLFNGCDAIVDASKLELPATTLADCCYYYMFYGCTSLVNAPALPATTLADRCYQYMFSNCTSLVNAPELPATTLAESCYYSMFADCTSLTTAPALPATILANWCYAYMFLDCTKLNYIKMLATDISAENCLNKWVGRVASSGTFVKNPDATWDVVGDNGVPSGWTVKFDGDGSVMPIVLNATSCSDTNSYTTPPSDNPNAKKLYEELMLLSNNTGQGNLDVGLVTIHLTSPLNSEYEQLLDVTSYSLAPTYIAEGILLYRESFYQYYVLQQDGTIQSVFYD